MIQDHRTKDNLIQKYAGALIYRAVIYSLNVFIKHLLPRRKILPAIEQFWHTYYVRKTADISKVRLIHSYTRHETTRTFNLRYDKHKLNSQKQHCVTKHHATQQRNLIRVLV